MKLNLGCTILMTTAMTSLIGASAHAESPVSIRRHASYAAPSYEDSIRIGLKGAFGFGGRASATVDGYTGRLKDDLEPTTGFALYGEYPLHRYLHVGLQTAFGWSIGESADDANGDRTFVTDISPFAKARLPLLNDKLELFVLVPIGLSISVPPDAAAPYVGTVDTGVGWNAGIQFGTTYFIHDGFGVSFEIGWQGRGTTNGTQANADMTTTTHQFEMNFGIFYAL